MELSANEKSGKSYELEHPLAWFMVRDGIDRV